jgi:hypothetical protein
MILLMVFLLQYKVVFGSRSKVVGIDLNSEFCGLNFIDVIRSLISDS